MSHIDHELHVTTDSICFWVIFCVSFFKNIEDHESRYHRLSKTTLSSSYDIPSPRLSEFVILKIVRTFEDYERILIFVGWQRSTSAEIPSNAYQTRTMKLSPEDQRHELQLLQLQTGSPRNQSQSPTRSQGHDRDRLRPTVRGNQQHFQLKRKENENTDAPLKPTNPKETLITVTQRKRSWRSHCWGGFNCWGIVTLCNSLCLHARQSNILTQKLQLSKSETSWRTCKHGKRHKSRAKRGHRAGTKKGGKDSSFFDRVWRPRRVPRWCCKRWLRFLCCVHGAGIVSITHDGRESAECYRQTSSRRRISEWGSIYFHSRQDGGRSKIIAPFG